MSETSLNGQSSGYYRSGNALVERVIALHDGGIELEFDFPEQVSPEDRASTWQLPARVLKSPGQPLRLLNRPELETRVRAWLEAGNMTQAVCGRWIFTWTAIKIECDPESVLPMLADFDLRPRDLREGALHNEHGARSPAPLRTNVSGGNGATYTAEMELDPEVMRVQRAEADVASAQMRGKQPLALEAAIQARQVERISGTIATTFETDSAGRVTRRINVIRAEIADQAGSLERESSRRQLNAGSSLARA